MLEAVQPGSTERLAISLPSGGGVQPRSSGFLIWFWKVPLASLRFSRPAALFAACLAGVCSGCFVKANRLVDMQYSLIYLQALPGGSSSMLGTVLPLLIMFGIAYFLIFLPVQRQKKRRSRRC